MADSKSTMGAVLVVIVVGGGSGAVELHRGEGTRESFSSSICSDGADILDDVPSR